MKYFIYLFFCFVVSSNAYGMEESFWFPFSYPANSYGMKRIEKGLEEHNKKCLSKPQRINISVRCSEGDEVGEIEGVLTHASINLFFPERDPRLLRVALQYFLRQAQAHGGQTVYTWTQDEDLYNFLLEEGFSSAGFEEDYAIRCGRMCCFRDLSSVLEEDRPSRGINTRVSFHHEDVDDSSSSGDSSSSVDIDESRFTVLLRNRRDEIVGGAIASIEREEVKRPSCYLESLWIEPSYRGRDFGVLLLFEVEERARELGLFKIELKTFSHQAPGFYQKQGYTPLVKIPKCKQQVNGKMSSLYLFQKIL